MERGLGETFTSSVLICPYTTAAFMPIRKETPNEQKKGGVQLFSESQLFWQLLIDDYNSFLSVIESHRGG